MNKEYEIKIHKGTTFERIIQIIVNGSLYKLTNGEKIIFGVKTHVNDNIYVIKKILTSSNHSVSSETDYVLTLSPDDTDLTPYRYVFDIGIKRSNGDFNIIFPPNPDYKAYFKVCGAVTKKEDTDE